MERGQHSEDTINNLSLLLDSAADLMSEMKQLSQELDSKLKEAVDLDGILSVLKQKRNKVETLKELVKQINMHLGIDAKGVISVQIPESSKLQLAGLVAAVRDLLEEESRIEHLICGHGFPIAKRDR